MKTLLTKRLSLVLLICMLFSMLGTACGVESEETVTPNGDVVEGLDNTDTSGYVDDGGIKGTYQPPEGEYDLEVGEGQKKLTLYWRGYDGSYADCDIWIWYDDVDGRGYLFTPCEYGAKVVILVPDTVTEVGFIVRKKCSEPGGTSWGQATKDGDNDRFAILTGKETYIFLENGDTNQYASDDGVKLVQIKKFNVAGMEDFHTIMYNITPAKRLENYQQVSVWDGDKKLTVTRVNMMGKNVGSGKITVEEKLDINKEYTVKIEGFEPVKVVPMGVFNSREFGELYNYDGNDLGSYINEDKTATTFKVWAPTASKVVLDLYEKGNEFDADGKPIQGTAADAYSHVEMTLGEKGVWSATVEGDLHKTYYTYTVTTTAGTETATDPYGRAAGLNGNRSMVVDLDLTNPENWTDDNFDPTFGGTVNFDSYSDAFIWEVHIRDFSNMLESSQYKGKYLAFTETGLTNANGIPAGVDYIKNLGVTHVHLLPSYDYATVKEENPDSGFNWGYDPKNYNVPEGSYSTDPYNGEVRINEYKQMVQALHNQGIGVIMDVVYNHTFSATDSNFHRIVPYYYYRYNANGSNMNASGCGNDTASERYMYRKYMVDSVTYWIKEYNLDGFRFDLMGLHDLETIRLVEEAVHNVNPKAIIYGEGWTMGSTIDGSEQANQTNIGKINTPTNNAIGTVAVFNDAIRNGLKGNSSFGTITSGILNGSATTENLNKVLFGIKGGNASGAGWKVSNSMVINYMSAHDNLALWDQLTLTMGGTTAAKAKANRLGAAILFVSKGTPFVQAGEEMLRTKPYYNKNGELVPGEYDENSYSSCDETNNLKWDTLTSTSEEYKMVQYYAGLVAMRKAYPIFSNVDTNIQADSLGSAGWAIHYKSGNQEAMVFINASGNSVNYTLNGTWKLVATVDKAGANAIATHNGGNVNVPAGGILVYVK